MVDTGCLAVFKVGDKIVFGDRGAYYSAERAPTGRHGGADATGSCPKRGEHDAAIAHRSAGD